MEAALVMPRSVDLLCQRRETQHKEAHHQAGLCRSDVERGTHGRQCGRLLSMPKDGKATRRVNSKVTAMEAGGTRMVEFPLAEESISSLGKF